MLKNFFNTEDSAVSFLAATNLGVSGVVKAVDNFEPVMHFLLVAGQIAVAVVTSIYVWRKSRAINAREDRNTATRRRLVVSNKKRKQTGK